MANTLEYAQIFQEALDLQYMQESVTSYLEPAAASIRYNGGNTVKMPDITLSALANYDRASGHVVGDITLTWEDYVLTQDRGRAFQIDAMDVDETNFVTTAATVMSEFQRVQVVPEIDAYRLSTISGAAIDAGNVTDTATIDPPEMLDALLDDLALVADRAGETVPLSVHMSATTRRALAASPQATFMFGVNQPNDSLDANLDTVNGATIRITSQNRLNSAITISATNGWAPATDSVPLRWVIVANGAAIAVSKADVPRIFDPMTNQTANAWRVDYRRYHDVWVPKNKVAGVHVNGPIV